MKKLFLTGILSSALSSISGFSSSPASVVYNFTCPAVKDITFQKDDNGNGSMTISAKAPSTAGMPDIGYWVGYKTYATTEIIGSPVLQNELEGLPYSPTCIYVIPASSYNLYFPVIPSNGDSVHNYVYSGTALAIKAIKKASR